MKKSIKKLKNSFKSPCLFNMDFFVLFIFFIPILNYGQSRHLDTISNAFNHKPKILLKLDSKFSFVSNQLVSMRGVKAGVNFNNRIKLGVGYSWMKNNFKFDNPSILINNENYDLRYSYVSIFSDYNFYNDKKWSFLFNTDFAVVKLGYKNKESSIFDFLSYGAVIEPSFISEYDLIKYITLGSGFGYRFVFRESNNIAEKFSAPLFIIRIKIDFLKIYNDELRK